MSNLSFSTVKAWMQDLVTKNIWVKLISIAIALLLWSYVVGERNVQIGLNVPLELRNVPGGYIVTNKIGRQVEMRVAGAKNLLNVLNASETSAFLDLTNAREGKNIFHINERNFKIPKDIKITSIYPESIEVILEKYIKKSVPVIPDIKDFSSIQDKITRLVVEPSSVTIEGPEVDIKNISRVKTETVQPTRFKGEENISVPIKLEGRFVRSVGGGMVTVRIKFR